ncbi:hypothetical protein GCM10011497_27930 [Elstera cyanobacteriorum]|uniref:DUF6456 domain-containing protein n=1 Tax=Elstera cyanobacteriorum TaxID=2022747 RepID=A0A255XS44_9PROT|nr:DUF6456 domain-containing protein [Elstera cyanobacteriorum]OYQ19827.1 hypothetical protein CHR90_06820 [Elstera cyanobacteriorum]GFZ95859.1 hypothetical protein GCM10011497_27930 [Elstera cyanobacteriorum]
MSISTRGLRSSTRSKTLIGRLRALPAETGPLSAPRPSEAPRPRPPRGEASALPLPPDLHAAAERLAELFAAAAFETWAQGGPTSAGACDPLDPTPEALVARRHYRAAMRAVPLPLSPLIVHVCCLGLPLGHWAATKNIARAEAERALRKALTHLLNHFCAQD